MGPVVADAGPFSLAGARRSLDSMALSLLNLAHVSAPRISG